MGAMTQRLNVLIAGGGVAGLEAALGLRDLARDRVATTMLAPDPEFVYRPLRVLEPFAGREATHYPLAEIARDVGMELRQDAFKWLDPAARVVHTAGGDELSYDALLLALGARVQPRFRYAVTLDDRRLDEQLHGVIQDVEAGYVHKLVFIAPAPMPWPLPLYELALMTARRAYEMSQEASITIVTPEDAPLAVFGTVVSRAVRELLDDAGIVVISASHAETPKPGEVALSPSGRRIFADRIIALPELFGPSTPGVPKRDAHGFIPVDGHCRVRGLDSVFAAGDATEMEVKHGGLASQQADVAAEGIAALAGVAMEPRKFRPEIHAVLLGGEEPLYLSARITGAHGSEATVSNEPTWRSGAKIDARYLTPYLESRDRAAV